MQINPGIVKMISKFLLFYFDLSKFVFSIVSAALQRIVDQSQWAKLFTGLKRFNCCETEKGSSCSPLTKHLPVKDVKLHENNMPTRLSVNISYSSSNISKEKCFIGISKHREVGRKTRRSRVFFFTKFKVFGYLINDKVS